MSVINRIAKGLTANVYSQLTTVFIQLISVPVLISVWGIEVYGEWVVMTSIPVYLAFSDLGLSTAAANKVAMLSEKGFMKLSFRVYRSCFFMVSVFAASLMIMLWALIVLIDVADVLSLENFVGNDLALLLLGLFMHAFLVMLGGVLVIPYRAIKRVPRATFFLSSIRFCEWGCALLVVANTSSALSMILTLLLIRVAGTILLALKARKTSYGFNLAGSKFDKKALKLIIKPALANMNFPLGLALTLQGTILLIATFLGNQAVAIFNVYRTISRLIIQAITAINQAIWPEFSYAQARKDKLMIEKIIAKVHQVGVLGGFVFVLFVFLSSELIIKIWTKGLVEYDGLLMLLLLVVTYAHVIWQKYWVFLMATNNHMYFAKCFLASSIFSLMLISLLISSLGIYIVPIILLLNEFVCWFASKKLFYRFI